MVSAWRNFKNIFSRPLFTIIFRSEMLKFYPYSILTGERMVGFVIFCVLITRRLDKSFISQNYTHYVNAYIFIVVAKSDQHSASLLMMYN